jgi:hypothetical protein
MKVIPVLFLLLGVVGAQESDGHDPVRKALRARTMGAEGEG